MHPRWVAHKRERERERERERGLTVSATSSHWSTTGDHYSPTLQVCNTLSMKEMVDPSFAIGSYL
jgi:hypothetical protein